MGNPETCAICEGVCNFLFVMKVRGEMDANVFECSECRFTFVKDPTWLDSSFSDQLNALDIGSVDRCLVFADFLEVFIKLIGNKSGRFLDWGGGYGLLTRLMRDRGLDFWNYDPYVQPLFVGPAIATENEIFDLVTMSEVALHITNPVAVFEKILETTDCILFSAVVAPNRIPVDWWYLMPDTGQHVAIYHNETLKALANQLGVNLTSDGRLFHVLHRKKLSPSARLLVKSRVLIFTAAWLMNTLRLAGRGFGRGLSLTAKDQQQMISELPWHKNK